MVEMAGSEQEGVASARSGDRTENLPTARQPPTPARALAHRANVAPTNPTRRANAGVAAAAAAAAGTTATAGKITAAATKAATMPSPARASRAMAKAALRKPRRKPKRAASEAAAETAAGTEVTADHATPATAKVGEGNNLARETCTE